MCLKMTKWILHLSDKSFQNTSNRIFRIQRWLLACSFATGNIACQISSAFSSPQCNDKIFRRKRCILSGIGPLFVLVKVHQTSMIFLTIRRTSIIFWVFTSCFYQNLYSIIFSGRGNLLKLIPVVVRARLIMFGLNQINHYTLIWFDESLALFRFWSKKKFRFCSFEAHFIWSVLPAARVGLSTSVQDFSNFVFVYMCIMYLCELVGALIPGWNGRVFDESVVDF